MRVLFLLFDSLNRHSLGLYGGTYIQTPNFDRLAERSVVFENHYVGSLPCMPARRDLHSGRLSMFHRSWGPLEPFDQSFPAILGRSDIYSHLVSDHYHYFEDGGWSYHNRYSTWEYIRGQEGDKWKAMVTPPIDRLREKYHKIQVDENRDSFRFQAMLNREAILEEQDFPSVQCIDAGLKFLSENKDSDNWFLQIETFDPHEPFHAPARFRKDYPTEYEGAILDWPRYREVSESPAEIAELRANYAALVSLCDEQLGRILDRFDQEDLWSNTAIVLTTDHGFLLGEHDLWGKTRLPCYNEVARIPLLIHHPDFQNRRGERRMALSQATDLMPTFLDVFGLSAPVPAQGRSLLPVLEADVPQRDCAVYGIFGGAVNITDGRYTYFRAPVADEQLYEYTLMPTHMHGFFEAKEFVGAQLVNPFDFTQGMPLLRLPALGDAKRPPIQGGGFHDLRTVLYDVASDPHQTRPVDDGEVERRLIELLRAEMIRHEAPAELFQRLGL
ncbi:MAG TPA: sulfatase [Microvirga sp.]|jgi:arylsulfatase A-like enzyme|nr:sulfatase [Microvirga sp.]